MTYFSCRVLLTAKPECALMSATVTPGNQAETSHVFSTVITSSWGP